jgi:hypothetical protein
VNRGFARLVYVVVLAVALSACTSSPAPTAPVSPPPPTTAAPSPSPTAVALVTHHLGQVTFVTPANWQVVIPREWMAPVGPELFLSNGAIADPCPSEFVSVETCLRPLAGLPPNGILVRLEGTAIAVPNNYTPPPTTMPPDSLCRGLGGELQIFAHISRGPNASACLRGPDLASNESAFLSFVTSFHE